MSGIGTKAETGAEVPPIEAAIVVQAAVSAAAMEIPEAATEEVSAVEAVIGVPPEGIPVMVSTEETDHLFFYLSSLGYQ